MPVLVKPEQETPVREWRRTAPIRAQFPSPQIGGSAMPWGTYCVGGAFIRYHGRPYGPGFPGPSMLAVALRYVNPNLNDYQSVEFAARIIGSNDRGAFDEAWQVVEEALAW